jgi:hypothetical protein
VSPDSATIDEGGSSAFIAEDQFIDCYQNVGEFMYVTDAIWTSSNESVATVSGGFVTGEDGGTATISAHWTEYTYHYNPALGACTSSSAQFTKSAAVTSIGSSIEADVTSVRPSGTDGTNTVTVTIRTNPATANRSVNLSLSGVAGSGGHASHSGTRPVGSLAATQGTTNGSGIFQTTYTAPIFGGTVNILSRVGQSNLEKVLEVIVAVEGLSELGASADYSLVGTTTTHPDNHYGTATALTNLPLIASDYLSQFSGAEILRYNDMSLVLGGKFDLSNNWSSGGDHSEHRIGINCDVYSGNVPQSRRDTLENIFRSRHSPDFLDETAAKSHWHLRFQ